ncbi:S10 family peptidase [Microvirga flavescens]|uniref:S10 family peptidase n=1 Tax=Microvirga flavescens TaxID=2249811 RepID=UPI000DD8CC17|nr:peptidase S10 [Microvirga flavescens]
MIGIARLSTIAALCLALSAPVHALAQEARPEPQRQESRQPESSRLPAESVTRHTLELPGRTLKFTATVGSLTLTDPQGKPQAEIGFVAYVKDDEDPAKRPVTFAVNGGPGASSAYLHLMAFGPWRLPVGEGSISPSAPVGLVPNAETWLDFTDLVFIDPPGTGYSRVVGDEKARESFYSVNGDIDGLAAVVMRWLKEKNRLASPKFYAGESYGGFRGPLLAEKLQSDQGIGFSGLVLVSPVFDFGWLDQSSFAPWVDASRLPSLTAARMARSGPVTRESLREVEAYASGEYLADLMKGLQDKAAVERTSRRVAALTGLDPALVLRLGGRVSGGAFQRETLRATGEVVSAYDADVAGYNPDPTALYTRFEDPVLTALTAPLTSAVIDHLTRTLNYRAEGRYNLLNEGVNRAWKWGNGRDPVENMSELRQALALDGKLRVLVVHGFTDLVTPYYASQLLLDQLPDFGPERRVALRVYGGGHMFYSRDTSRQTFRADVQRLFQDALNGRNGSKKD